MKLYLDDDSCASALVAMLRKAGHDVVIPADFGLSGGHDTEHLLRSVLEHRVFLSHNYKDFDPTHKLVLGCSGVHFGILLVRRDNDPRKSLTHKGIVSAIRNVDLAYTGLSNELITLNDWR